MAVHIRAWPRSAREPERDRVRIRRSSSTIDHNVEFLTISLGKVHSYSRWQSSLTRPADRHVEDLVLMISFAASDVNISVVVEEADAERAVHGLHREFFSDFGDEKGAAGTPSALT